MITVDLIGPQRDGKLLRHRWAGIELRFLHALNDLAPGLRIDDLRGIFLRELTPVQAVRFIAVFIEVDAEAVEQLHLLLAQFDLHAAP